MSHKVTAKIHRIESDRNFCKDEIVEVLLDYNAFADLRFYKFLQEYKLAEPCKLDSSILRVILPGLYKAIVDTNVCLEGSDFVVEDFDFDSYVILDEEFSVILYDVIPDIKRLSFEKNINPKPLKISLSDMESASMAELSDLDFIWFYNELYWMYNELGAREDNDTAAKAKRMMEMWVLMNVSYLSDERHTVNGLLSYGFYNLDKNSRLAEKSYILALDVADRTELDDNACLFDLHWALADFYYYHDDLSDRNVEEAFKHYSFALEISWSKESDPEEKEKIEEGVADIKDTLSDLMYNWPEYEERVLKILKE